MMRMKIQMLAMMFIAALALGACSDDDDKDDVKVPEAMSQALKSKYPSAIHVEWEQKGGYFVADCKVDARNTAAGTEIMLAGRTLHRRTVVGNAQQRKPLPAGRLRHLVDGVVRMTAGYRMGVNIQNIKHVASPPPSARDTMQSPDQECRFLPYRSRFPAQSSSALCC